MLVNDSLVEMDETFLLELDLELLNDSRIVINSSGAITVVIKDDDSTSMRVLSVVKRA